MENCLLARTPPAVHTALTVPVDPDVTGRTDPTGRMDPTGRTGHTGCTGLPRITTPLAAAVRDGKWTATGRLARLSRC